MNKSKLKQLNKVLVIGLVSIVMLALGLSALVVHSHAYWYGDDYDGYFYTLPFEYEYFTNYDFTQGYGYTAPYYFGNGDGEPDFGWSWDRDSVTGEYNGYMSYIDDLSGIAHDVHAFRLSMPDYYFINSDLPGNFLTINFDYVNDITNILPDIDPYATDIGFFVNLTCSAYIGDTLDGGDPDNYWHVYEQYSYDFDVTDFNGSPVSFYILGDFFTMVNSLMQDKADGINDLYDLIDGRSYVYTSNIEIQVSFIGYGNTADGTYFEEPTRLAFYPGEVFLSQKYSETDYIQPPSLLESPIINDVEPVPPDGVIDWLVATVSGVFDTSLFGIPGLTLGTLLLIPICAGAIVGLLKLFAGG